MSWRNAAECRADCEECDWEAYGPLIRITRDAKKHKADSGHADVVIWREQWKVVPDAAS